jgi:hypothetical protein
VVQELVDRTACLVEGAQLVLLGIEIAERLGDVAQHGGVEGWQRLGQRMGEHVRIGPLRQLGLAQLQQQGDERPVALLAEPEEAFVEGTSPGTRPVEDPTAAVEGVGEPLMAQRAVVHHELEVAADPPLQQEEPAAHAASGDRLEAAAESAVLGLALGVQAPELEPGVALAFVVPTPEQQVPLHALAAVAVGFDP